MLSVKLLTLLDRNFRAYDLGLSNAEARPQTGESSNIRKMPVLTPRYTRMTTPNSREEGHAAVAVPTVAEWN
ncbi:hypothetical protein THI4931_17890 [Pandoraea sputorum]|nr:hypothetical protein THI4931_17890 [Pandoraea sputorum]